MRPLWSILCPSHQRTIILDVIERLETVHREQRTEAMQIVLYLLQGAFIDFADKENAQDDEVCC